jgi:CheY-like chemotaxis protein
MKRRCGTGKTKKEAKKFVFSNVTGSDRETVRKKVERGPVDSVLFKPFRLEDLQRTVQGALAFRERGHGSVGVG